MSTNRPRLTLIGAMGMLAGTSLLTSCDDNATIAVQRAHYATLADCERDWERPDDCTFEPDGATPASGVSQTVHGGHSAVGHWSGPYYTKSGKVYHSDGSTTNETVTTRNATSTSAEHVSAHDVSKGSGGDISRGGFGESAHGGGEGGHGGGEGGGGGGGHGGGG